MLDLGNSELLIMFISGWQFVINHHSPKWMVVRLDFVYISPFCFLALTHNCRRRFYNLLAVTDSKLQQMFLAFIYCSSIFLVFMLSLLSTSKVTLSQSEPWPVSHPLNLPSHSSTPALCCYRKWVLCNTSLYIVTVYRKIVVSL